MNLLAQCGLFNLNNCSVSATTATQLKTTARSRWTSAQIRFAMPVTQHVTLKVYDVTGREVRTLISGPVKAGVHTVDWNGKDNLSRSVSAGVYFVRMATEGYQASRKTVLLK